MTTLDEKTNTVEVTVNDENTKETEETFPYNGVVVYTKPSCQPCKMTKRSLTTAGIKFTAIDIAEFPEAADTLIAEGFMTMPVVKLIDGTTWSGYKPDLIKALIEAETAEK